jgi:hypothetical protein
MGKVRGLERRFNGKQEGNGKAQAKTISFRKLQRKKPYVKIPMEKILEAEEGRKRNCKKSMIGKDVDSKDKAESSNNAQTVNKEEPSHQINPGSVVEPMVSSEKVQEDDEITDNFESDSEASFNVICNVVSVLLKDYDRVMEVEDEEDEMEEETMVHRPVCYYVMNNGCVEEQNAFFERPDDSMKAHLKPYKRKGGECWCKQDTGRWRSSSKFDASFHAKEDWEG